MAGNKRNKLKKMLSPRSPTPPPTDYVPDDELMDDLMSQLDSKDPTVSSESAQVMTEINREHKSPSPNVLKKDSKARFEARQARKAENLAANYAPTDEAAEARARKEAEDEDASIRSTSKKLGLVIHDIDPDGHCLFSAIADQLSILRVLPPNADYSVTRTVAAQYIFDHRDDFLPFLPASGEGGISSDTGLMTEQQFGQYCTNMRDTGTWGGEPEILALSRAYNIPISVVQGSTPPIVEHTPTGQPVSGKVPTVYISFHRRMYGLGEHYNSLRPAPTGLARIPEALSTAIH